MTIQMRKIRVNQKAVIKSVTAKGELGRRIRDMGLISGAEFIIIGKAPLFDPVAVKMQGFTITLRNSEADFITCELPEAVNM